MNGRHEPSVPTSTACSGEPVALLRAFEHDAPVLAGRAGPAYRHPEVDGPRGLGG